MVNIHMMDQCKLINKMTCVPCQTPSDQYLYCLYVGSMCSYDTHFISKARLCVTSRSYHFPSFVKLWSRYYRTVFMLNSTEHDIYPAHNVKMPTPVGILTLSSWINTTS